ncbi:MAG TPA: YciI family protein [Candidatus Acidoferrum sp.]|nr:YciI family protein [Candidatus Acidoferrum sp.]
MKYLLLIYGAEDAWSQAEREECVADSVALCHELSGKGQYLSAAPLQPVSTATSVRNHNGRKIVTDGPFAETREQLAGYFLIDVPDLDAALEIAKRLPGGRKGTVEVRPLVEPGKLPKTPS